MYLVNVCTAISIGEMLYCTCWIYSIMNMIMNMKVLVPSELGQLSILESFLLYQNSHFGMKLQQVQMYYLMIVESMNMFI